MAQSFHHFTSYLQLLLLNELSSISSQPLPTHVIVPFYFSPLRFDEHLVSLLKDIERRGETRIVLDCHVSRIYHILNIADRDFQMVSGYYQVQAGSEKEGKVYKLYMHTLTRTH